MCEYFRELQNIEDGQESFGDVIFNKKQRPAAKYLKELDSNQAQECITSLHDFGMVTFVNGITGARRNGVPVLGIRVKEFQDG